MKYRTDFVTNSSSESFYIVTAKYENGTIEEILEDNAPRTQLYDVQQEEDGLYLNGSKIKTKEELCAALLFDNYGIEGIDNIPVEILAALFTFIIGKNNPIELAAQIKRFSELECQYSDDGEKVKDKYDFSILDSFIATMDNIGICIKVRNQNLVHISIYRIIAVNKGNQVTGCHIKPTVPGRRNSTVRLVNDNNAVLIGSKPVTYFSAFIERTIVCQQNLHITVVLRNQALNAIFKRIGNIVNRRND